MFIKIFIKNDDYEETVIVEDVKDKNNFIYTDSFGAENEVFLEKESVEIKRVTDTHSTTVFLSSDNSFIYIETVEGKIKFDVKIVDLYIKDNIITIAYLIEGSKREINIYYFED